MKNFLVIFLLFISCLYCNGQEKIELKGTKWKCKIAEGCINVYEFKTDSTFTFLSCEMEDEYYGDYYFKDGFLMIDEKGSIYGENLSDSSINKKERKLYKVKINDDELKHLEICNWVNGKWIMSNFKFDDSYIYKKMNY